MKKREDTESTLQIKLYETLKTDNKDRNQEINVLCKEIASAVIELSLELSSKNLDLYISKIELLNSKIPNFDQNLGKALKVIKDEFLGDENKDLRECIDAPLIRKLLKRDDVQEKLSVLTESRVNQNHKFQNVNNMLRDKNVAKQDEFKAKQAKQNGVSAGYISSEKETDKTFILKQFYKKPEYALEEKDKNIRRQKLSDIRDGVRELLGASMYQLLLYDRAPKEGLVIPNEANPKSLYVRSKFFENVVSFKEFARQKDIRKLEGLEKLIASCHMLGELDYHGGNIMVQTQKNAKGRKQYILTKIDHGRSLTDFNSDFGSMIDKTYKNFDIFGYNDSKLPFSVEKYSESLKQMINSFSEDQIDKIVDQKVAELKQAGFDPNGLPVGHRFGNDSYIPTTFNNNEDMSLFYKESLKKNLHNMEAIAKRVDVITKFSNVSQEFKNGEWLKAFANSKTKDPVAFATHNNIKIEGKNPLQWAYEHGYKIEKKYYKNKQFKIEKDGTWKITKIPVDKQVAIIENLDPLDYIADVQNKTQLSESEREFLSQAAEFGLKYADSMNYNEALKILDITIDQNAVDRMHNKDQKISEGKLLPLIDDFVKTHLTQQNITKDDIVKLYDNVLNILKKDDYISEQDITKMKTKAKGQDFSNFDKSVNDTFDLVKMTTPQITGFDKMKYAIASFCKSIGVDGIANYFMKKISPDNLNKIHNTEKLLAESLKMAELINRNIGKESVTGKRVENIQSKTIKEIARRAETHNYGRS